MCVCLVYAFGLLIVSDAWFILHIIELLSKACRSEEGPSSQTHTWLNWVSGLRIDMPWWSEPPACCRGRKFWLESPLHDAGAGSFEERNTSECFTCPQVPYCCDQIYSFDFQPLVLLWHCNMISVSIWGAAWTWWTMWVGFDKLQLKNWLPYGWHEMQKNDTVNWQLLFALSVHSDLVVWIFDTCVSFPRWWYTCSPFWCSRCFTCSS